MSSPGDLAGYSDCHFFAGIGGWAYALRLAGVEGRGIWTGSCPCQPFSVAGKGKGTDDERHLWPEFYRLIGQCQPAKVFGEQVASPLGRSWLASVFADLEDVGYAVAGADLCAAGVGAPHIRQRLWWVAHGDRTGQRPPIQSGSSAEVRHRWECGGSLCGLERGGAVDGVAHDGHPERRQVGVDREDGCDRQDGGREEAHGVTGTCGEVRGVADAGRHEAESGGPVAEAGGNGVWARAEYIECLDGKARPVEPGIFPVANGFPGRVGTLRGSGNAIVPQLAAEFVAAACDL